MLAIKTKNILFVSQYLYPHGGGGSGRFVYDNARHLAQAGYQVDILLPRAASDLKYQIDDDHINIHSFGSRLYFILKKFIPRTILDLIWSRHYVKKLLKKQKYYLVVFHHLPAAAFCFNLKNLRGQKWLYQFYASPFMEWKFEHEAAYTPAKKVFGFFLLWLEKRLYAHAPRLIVLSRYTKNILTDNFKVPVEKITELSGAVDTAQFYRRQIVPAEINSLWPANTFKLLSVRRLEKRMGLEMLIKAVALLKEQGCKISLVIAGTG
ncbi:MAG: glycosyltransferase family 4 protein, partial [Patescibacteria group bacterium]